jgi:hypothetical protein
MLLPTSSECAHRAAAQQVMLGMVLVLLLILEAQQVMLRMVLVLLLISVAQQVMLGMVLVLMLMLILVVVQC